MRDWNRMVWASGAVAGLIFALASIFVPEELLVRFKSLTGPIEDTQGNITYFRMVKQ